MIRAMYLKPSKKKVQEGVELCCMELWVELCCIKSTYKISPGMYIILLFGVTKIMLLIEFI